MTNEAAKMWIKCLGPVIRSVHKKFGRLLGFSIGDIEQEAWILADAIISAKRLDPNQRAISYVSVSVHNRFRDLARFKMKETAGWQRASLWEDGSGWVGLERLYTLDTTPEFFNSLSEDELAVCEALILADSMGEIMASLRLTRYQYDKIKRSLEQKALDHVRC